MGGPTGKSGLDAYIFPFNFQFLVGVQLQLVPASVSGTPLPLQTPLPSEFKCAKSFETITIASCTKKALHLFTAEIFFATMNS